MQLNLIKCLFFKDSFQWFFSKEGIKPDRSKQEETEKTHKPKYAKKRSFLGFPNYVKRFIPNHTALKYTYTSFKRTYTYKSKSILIGLKPVTKL